MDHTHTGTHTQQQQQQQFTMSTKSTQDRIWDDSSR